MFFMKSTIRKCISLALAATVIFFTLCFGSVISAAGSDTAQNVIRIIVDDETFKNYYTGDYQYIYCLIYDDTADENVTSWISNSNHAKMTQVGDTNTWSYDLDEHGITLDPTHTYSVQFTADLIRAQTDYLVIDGYDSAKDYTAVFTEIFTYQSFTGGPIYLYKWIGENEFDVGLDIIRINVDKNTFWHPIESLYCRIVDETAYEEIIEMGRMTKEAEPDTWSFDLGKHGAVLNPEHTYTVVFHDGRGQTAPLTISAYDRANDYTAFYTGRYITDNAGNSSSEYVWSGDYVMLYGDADCDGDVTILDATVIQRVLVNMSWESFSEKAADVSGDGLDITDATLIQRFLAGMIDHFPVENETANG